MDAFDEEAVILIKSAFQRTTNPIHRARYADFLWERCNEFRMAQAAIDAYQELAELYLANGWYESLADALDRAAELALKINDRSRIEHTKTLAFRIADELVHNERHPVYIYTRNVIHTLQGFDLSLSDEEWSTIVTLIEDAVACYDHEGTGTRSFLELLTTSLAQRRQPALVPVARKRIAASFEAEARDAMCDKGSLVGLTILREALNAYANVGDTAKVDEMKRRIAEAAAASESEMKTVSITVSIPREAFEHWTNQVLQLTLEHALATLAAADRHIPDVQTVRADAARNRRRFPMQWLVSRMTLDDTRVVDAPTSEDDIERSSFLQQYGLDRGLRTVELSLILDRLESEKGLNTTVLIDILRRGGIVGEATLDTVSIGLDRYFAKDYVSAFHILVPQLEDVLRDFLRPLNVATTSTRDGLTREKPLDEILRTPDLRNVLGENLVVFLEFLLIE
jgi:hypothetical protein